MMPKRWRNPRVATVAYRLRPEEKPLPSMRLRVSRGFMEERMNEEALAGKAI